MVHLEESQPGEDPEHRGRLRAPKALEGRCILYPEYMRSCVALEGKGEPLRAEVEVEVGHALGVVLGHKKSRVAKSPLGGDIRNGSHAENTTGSVWRRRLRTQARKWGQRGADTFRDANLRAHQ